MYCIGERMSTLTVKCLYVDPVHFAYKCPYCNEKHYHGSSNELHNRVEHRQSHCLKTKHLVKVIIDDTTKREYK